MEFGFSGVRLRVDKSMARPEDELNDHFLHLEELTGKKEKLDFTKEEKVETTGTAPAPATEETKPKPKPKRAKRTKTESAPK